MKWSLFNIVSIIFICLISFLEETTLVKGLTDFNKLLTKKKGSQTFKFAWPDYMEKGIFWGSLVLRNIWDIRKMIGHIIN